MLNFIPTLYSKFFGPIQLPPMSAPPAFSEAATERAKERAREVTASEPEMSEEDLDALTKAIGEILRQPAIEDAPTSQRGGYRPGAGRPRKFGFYDLEVGRSCRAPRSAATSVRAAAYTHARTTGKVFTTRTHANGLWIKRVA